MVKVIKKSFVVIGKEGSTLDGEGFIQKLWDDANSHFGEVAHLAKKDANGGIVGIWGAMDDNLKNRRLSYGMSNGLRTLHDEGILKMEHFLDQKDIWTLYPLKAHPIRDTENGVTYISGIRKEILEELNLPVITFTEVSAPKREATTEGESKKRTAALPEKKEPETATSVTAEIQEKVGAATDALMQWSGGRKIDISANVGISGVLRAAVEDMNAFLFSAIDWQAEGISMDHVNKVKKSAVKIIALENQTKGMGLYYMPANIESVIVIGAFVRWRQYGKSSWNYEPDADCDAYAQYMTAFNRNFGGSSGGGGGGGNHNNNGGGGGDGSGCGCLIAIAVVVVLILIVLGG